MKLGEVPLAIAISSTGAREPEYEDGRDIAGRNDFIIAIIRNIHGLKLRIDRAFRTRRIGDEDNHASCRPESPAGLDGGVVFGNSIVDDPPDVAQPDIIPVSKFFYGFDERYARGDSIGFFIHGTELMTMFGIIKPIIPEDQHFMGGLPAGGDPVRRHVPNDWRCAVAHKSPDAQVWVPRTENPVPKQFYKDAAGSMSPRLRFSRRLIPDHSGAGNG